MQDLYLEHFPGIRSMALYGKINVETCRDISSLATGHWSRQISTIRGCAIDEARTAERNGRVTGIP
jgi:hypothetical protein